MEKTINLEHEIGDDVIIRILGQKGIVSSIGIQRGGSIRYQVEYSLSGNLDSRRMDGFEIEKPKEGNAMGFTKPDKED